MLALHAKRGIETSVERIFSAHGGKFDTLSFRWVGKTAAVSHKKSHRGVDAQVIFPDIDDTADVSRELFFDFEAYAIHELGHVWFTDNEPWDRARDQHGAFVSAIVNGLEDPRIEKMIIDSPYAPNARLLFETLVNNILKEDGYVKPDDLGNIPFLLAIEGRRLNGYNIGVPSVLDQSPWAQPLTVALNDAHKAKNTATIVRIAIDLCRALEKESNKKSDKGSDEKQGQGNGQGEGKGKEPGNEPGDEPGNEPGGGHGIRPVEPGDHISKRLGREKKIRENKGHARPGVGKPIYQNFNWD